MRTLLLILLFAVSSSKVFAAPPKVDPELIKELSAANSTTLTTAILMFHDKMNIPSLAHDSASRVQVELALIENAKKSQMETLQRLMLFKKQGVPITIESLWLINGALIKAPTTILKGLFNNEDISSIQSNSAVFAPRPRSDPMIMGPKTYYTYNLAIINLPALQKRVPQLKGRGVRIGLLDTGIEPTQPDLVGKILLFKDFVNGKTAAYDDNGHGTHLSGVMVGGNASGTNIGMAPEAKLIVGKMLNADSHGQKAVTLQSMQWIADPDGDPSTEDQPQVINDSWIDVLPSPGQDPKDEPYCKALAAWTMLGIVPVFAAGNSGPGPSTVGIPAACPQALAVGATDADDKVVDWSSRGPANWKSVSYIRPTVVAPGNHVMSSWPDGGWRTDSGTSMAAPHVTGLVALLFQAFPKLSVEEVMSRVIHGAKYLRGGEQQGPSNDFGAGRIDAYKTFFRGIND